MKKEKIKIGKREFYQMLSTGQFASMIEESTRNKKISNSGEVFNIIKPLVEFNGNDVEHFFCIFLDSKNKIIAIEKLFSGTISSASIYPREIVKKIIDHKATSIIVAHNHPSNDCSPSIQDNIITKRLFFSCSAIDVNFFEHIIIGSEYYSFADHGIINQINKEYQEFTNNFKLNQ